MHHSNQASGAKSRIGVDPWGKNVLIGSNGFLPSTAKFLCTFSVSTIVDSVEVDLFVNRTLQDELEIWDRGMGFGIKLLSRTIADNSLSASEQHIDALFEICRCWLGFQGVQGLVKPGLFQARDWRQLEQRLDAEWRRIGEAKTKAIQAQLAGRARRKSIKNEDK